MLPDSGGSAACLASGPSNEGPFLWPQLGGSLEEHPLSTFWSSHAHFCVRQFLREIRAHLRPETQGEKALVTARLRAGTVQKGLRPAFSGAAHHLRPGEE